MLCTCIPIIAFSEMSCWEGRMLSCLKDKENLLKVAELL